MRNRLIGLPPLTGSKCLVRETGHLGPRKKGTSRCPRSVFQSSRSLVTSVKQRFSWRKARRLARYAGISEYRNRVTIVGVGRYGGLKVDQARRLKELERENTRLRRAVADLTLEKLVLKEATEGNW